MKFVSWNVNGLQACLSKGFLDFFREAGADIFCLQETKVQEGQVGLDLPGYLQYWNSTEKKGYSGAAVFIRKESLPVCYDIRRPDHTGEGHVITLEFESFYLVNVYTPSSQRELTRLPYRMEWENVFCEYITQLDEKKPVTICGDLDVAHQEIGLENAKSDIGNAGFLYEERGKLTGLLVSGFLDSFCEPYPDLIDAYAWRFYMFKACQNNAGWRIDYFLISGRLWEKLSDSLIYPEVQGSDYCPAGLMLTCNQRRRNHKHDSLFLLQLSMILSD